MSVGRGLPAAAQQEQPPEIVSMEQADLRKGDVIECRGRYWQTAGRGTIPLIDALELQ